MPPDILYSFSIDKNYKVSIFKRKISIHPKTFSFLEPGNKCTTYSTLNLLAAELKIFEFQEDIYFSESIKNISNEIENLYSMENLQKTYQKKLEFLSEQLSLIRKNMPRYSSDLLIFASLFYMSYPAAYRFLRESDYLTLPSPNYLSSFNKGNIQTGAASKHLAKQFEYLDPHEKYVCLLIDEIYVKPQISYKGNKLIGVAENQQASNITQAATTVQAIMISSLLSKHTDVVGLYPIRRLDGFYLSDLLDDALTLLHNIGYEVLIIIGDNHAVNNRGYKILSQSEKIPTSIANKYVSGNKRLFFSFDSPHILKCLRNIFQRVKNFHFPSLELPGTFRMASISHLEKVYEIERFNTLKLAPQLTYKVLHTSSLDKQNVYLATCIFNKKNIEALQFYRDQLGANVDGTIEFLTIIVNLWDILNVKSPEKGFHLQNEYMKPINKMTNLSILYLRKLSVWFISWYNCTKPSFSNSDFYNEITRVGKLTKETHTAVTHTINTMINISEYLLTDTSFDGLFKYVLLGNFSTDKLEFLFSLYRKMSGHNYHVSVRQIIESQKKLNCLKALKLKSTSNSCLSLKSFLQEFTFNEMSLCPVEKIDEILSKALDVLISSADINAIVYCSGYVALKTMERLKCHDCGELLMLNCLIDAEFTPETVYMTGLNCGGLKYPTDFSTEIGIRALQVFRSLTSENFETLFIKSANHKNFLFSIITEYSESLLYNLPIDPICGHSSSKILDISVTIWTNILLNNYTKELNDSAHQCTVGTASTSSADLTKRRKLATFGI